MCIVRNGLKSLPSMRLCPALAFLLLLLPAWAQPNAAASSSEGTVTFRFVWNDGIPWQKYSIAVEPDGRTRFDGIPAPDENTSQPDPFQQDFIMSDANRRTVAELARKLDAFRGDYDSHLKKIAQTGSKTLEYRSATVQGSTTYNYSQNADVQQLTHLFQGIATTMDYGRRLAFQYRFDKLGMDERLKQLEDLQASHGVEELQIIAPMLRKIWNDPNLMNISRESARRLLVTIEPPANPAQNPAR